MKLPPSLLLTYITVPAKEQSQTRPSHHLTVSTSRSFLLSMLSLLTVTAVAVYIFIPVIEATGSATIISKCPYPVYFASASGWNTPPTQRLEGSYTETYSRPGVGISIKLSLNETGAGPITQFEYTWDANRIYYDLSNIDGYPLAVDGIRLEPSVNEDPRYPTCTEVNCQAGHSYCASAYNQPNDTRTLVCDDQTDLTVTVCPEHTSPVRRHPLPPHSRRHAHSYQHHSRLLK